MNSFQLLFFLHFVTAFSVYFAYHKVWLFQEFAKPGKKRRRNVRNSDLDYKIAVNLQAILQ